MLDAMVVEVTHVGFNRFRKLLWCGTRSFLALKHLTASITAFRKISASLGRAVVNFDRFVAQRLA